MGDRELEFIYVRHSQVAVRPDQPSGTWSLSEAGREAARALGERLQRAGITSAGIACSREEKAIETARALAPFVGAADVLALPGLDEAARPWTDGDYRSVAEDYLQGRAVTGWEPIGEVVQRVAGAVRVAAGQDFRILVGHGLSFTAWLGAVAPDISPVEFWRGLAFPDARRVNLATGEVWPLPEA